MTLNIQSVQVSDIARADAPAWFVQDQHESHEQFKARIFEVFSYDDDEKSKLARAVADVQRGKAVPVPILVNQDGVLKAFDGGASLFAAALCQRTAINAFVISISDDEYGFVDAVYDECRNQGLPEYESAAFAADSLARLRAVRENRAPRH